MNITELLPLIESLPHDDKFRLMQFLVSKLAVEEGISLENKERAVIKPVGRIYYSKQSDNSRRAKELLFSEKKQRIQQRQKEC